MPVELFNKDNHVCVAFRDLVSGEAVQANQFLIFDSDHAALIDPGGDLTYTGLFMEISNYMNVKSLDYVVASHQDPDIVASLNKWLVGTHCKDDVLPFMDAFHKRYMNSNKVCHYWANMAAAMDISMIVPQHGRAFTGKAVAEFIGYISNLKCGVDLVTQDNYRLP